MEEVEIVKKQLPQKTPEPLQVEETLDADIEKIDLPKMQEELKFEEEECKFEPLTNNLDYELDPSLDPVCRPRMFTPRVKKSSNNNYLYLLGGLVAASLII